MGNRGFGFCGKDFPLRLFSFFSFAPLRKPVFAGAALGAAALFSPITVWAAPPQQVVYTVSVVDTVKRQFQVTARAEGVSEDTVTFALPAWSPGWYVLTNAVKNISDIRATGDDNKPLTVTQDKLTWSVATNGAKNVTVSYTLLAKDQDPEAVGTATGTVKDYGFFAPYLDDKNGFVPGPASLFYVVNGKSAPCRITYKVPSGWKIASANDPVEGDPTTFTAPNYDTLADQPAELGTFARYDKTINGTPYSVVLVGAGDTDTKKWVDSCFKIAEAGQRVFGGSSASALPGGIPPASAANASPSATKTPFPRYIFHFRFVPDSPAMMGLEHLNSTVITMPPTVLSTAEPEALGIVAHEYTHAWNVKRVRPEGLGPFDYTQPVRVKDLWWSEGVTDYYAPRLLVEAGLVGPEFWRGYMTQMVTELQNNPARQTVTLETASLKAWEGRSEGFGGLSYYVKGLVVGMLLDIELRRDTNNKAGLDDLLRSLWAKSDETGKGFPPGEIERQASRIAGKDLTAFFDTALRSTEELPYDTILSAAGLKLSQFAFSVPDLGLDLTGLRVSGSIIQLGDVTPGGPAETAGLKKGDVITAINGKPVAQIVASIFQTMNPGQVLSLTVERDGKPSKVRLTLGERKQQVFEIARSAAATSAQQAILDAISGTTNARIYRAQASAKPAP